MSSTYNQQKGRDDFEDWDSVFEDSEPTRSLTAPQDQQFKDLEGRTLPLESHAHHQNTLSATRSGTVPSSIHRQQVHPATAQLPLHHEQTNINGAGTGPVPPQLSAPVDVYRRIQFLPASSGALIAYALGTGLFTFLESVFSAFGIATYSSLTGSVLAVTVASTQGQALPWVIGSAIIWLVSFGWAGYAAARMSAVAPVKQALGVIAVSLLATLLATLVTWASASLPSPVTPGFALQPLLAPDLATGFLTALSTMLIATLGAVLGALFGIRYPRALTSVNS